MKIASKVNSPSIIFLLSAKDYHSLKSLAGKYLDFLQETNYKLLDICYSLLIRNTFFKHKLQVMIKQKQAIRFI